ncbi:unnamed protein product [Larinioides sclopetarius]|uniref:Uncharacterized protein n=1 Tax=Larinioides sclopetarius TaxID=280406 RepID=A0AAV2BL79_9ARAC
MDVFLSGELSVIEAISEFIQNTSRFPVLEKPVHRIPKQFIQSWEICMCSSHCLRCSRTRPKNNRYYDPPPTLSREPHLSTLSRLGTAPKSVLATVPGESRTHPLSSCKTKENL